MAELAHSTQPEFWRPPTPRVEGDLEVRETATGMAEACPRCGTEYLFGSRFCHSCGGRRPEAINSAVKVAALPRLWGKSIHSFRTMLSGVSIRDLKLASLVQYLSFHEIKSRVGLSTASFLAFLIGLGCVAGALLVGFLSAKTLVDWQAIQFYRAEWLLAATACFAAGILLKKEFPGNHD